MTASKPPSPSSSRLYLLFLSFRVYKHFDLILTLSIAIPFTIIFACGLPQVLDQRKCVTCGTVSNYRATLAAFSGAQKYPRHDFWSHLWPFKFQVEKGKLWKNTTLESAAARLAHSRGTVSGRDGEFPFNSFRTAVETNLLPITLHFA